MALKKHGIGEVTGTESSLPKAKTAASAWSDDDAQALEDENSSADNKED